MDFGTMGLVSCKPLKDSMKARIIKTESDYEQALARIDVLMGCDPEPETDEGRELELLSMLVEQYEELHFPVDLPGPIEAIRFRMEQGGLKQADLIPFIGSKSKVSEVLSGKRPLSLNMIRKLHVGLGIPAEALLGKSGDEFILKGIAGALPPQPLRLTGRPSTAPCSKTRSAKSSNSSARTHQ
jgi:HTH-type transcriptional regulator/antitoxin HigA